MVFTKRKRKNRKLVLSSYRNTRESLRKLKKAVETLTCGSCSYSISSFSQTFTCVYMFLFLNYCLSHDVIITRCSQRHVKLQSSKWLPFISIAKRTTHWSYFLTYSLYWIGWNIVHIFPIKPHLPTGKAEDRFLPDLQYASPSQLIEHNFLWMVLWLG